MDFRTSTHICKINEFTITFLSNRVGSADWDKRYSTHRPSLSMSVSSEQEIISGVKPSLSFAFLSAPKNSKIQNFHFLKVNFNPYLLQEGMQRIPASKLWPRNAKPFDPVCPSSWHRLPPRPDRLNIQRSCEKARKLQSQTRIFHELFKRISDQWIWETSRKNGR